MRAPHSLVTLCLFSARVWYDLFGTQQKTGTSSQTSKLTTWSQSYDDPTPGAIMTFHYHYSALPEGNIRLLLLSPHGGDKYAPIECQLLLHPLLDQDDGPGLYEALSYAWGSAEKPEHICIDKYNVSVTASLHAALHQLRNRSLPRLSWADAICIDQDNTEELNKQVQMMALIYAKAAKVIVWLGDATADSDQAIEDIRVAAWEDRNNPNRTMKVYADRSSISALLERSWFERVWVRHLVALGTRYLADSPLFRCYRKLLRPGMCC